MCKEKPLRPEVEPVIKKGGLQDVNVLKGIKEHQFHQLSKSSLCEFTKELDRKLMDADGGWTSKIHEFTNAYGLGAITSLTPILDVHLAPTVPSIDGYRGIRMPPPVSAGMLHPAGIKDVSMMNWDQGQRVFWTRVCNMQKQS